MPKHNPKLSNLYARPLRPLPWQLKWKDKQEQHRSAVVSSLNQVSSQNNSMLNSCLARTAQAGDTPQWAPLPMFHTVCRSSLHENVASISFNLEILVLFLQTMVESGVNWLSVFSFGFIFCWCHKYQQDISSSQQCHLLKLNNKSHTV
jgi:hypothetical protein